MLTRRSVLVLGAAAGAVAAVPGTASARVGTRAPWGSLLRRSDYAVALGKTFFAVGEDGKRYKLKLVAIRDIAHVKHLKASREHAFNLLFKPLGAAAPDGIYRLTSAHARASQLFLSAVGPHGSDRRVQALVVRNP